MTGLESMYIADFRHGQRWEGDGCVVELRVSEELRVPGQAAVRPSVLFTLADVGAGMVANRLTDRIALTVDLALRCFRPVELDRVVIDSRLVKAGRNTIVTESWLSSEPGAEPVGVAYGTFIQSPREGDAKVSREGSFAAEDPLFSAPFAEQLGAVVAAPGVVELARHPYVLQPTGTLQGGTVGLLVELAAHSLTGRPVGDLEVRFLTTVRQGPARTSASVLGAGLVRVEVRDTGNANRLAALGLVRLAEPPG